jgi:hypothetical protein
MDQEVQRIETVESRSWLSVKFLGAFCDEGLSTYRDTRYISMFIMARDLRPVIVGYITGLAPPPKRGKSLLYEVLFICCFDARGCGYFSLSLRKPVVVTDGRLRQLMRSNVYEPGSTKVWIGSSHVSR